MDKTAKRVDVRYYSIGGVTICLRSGLPFKDSTFQAKFEKFRVAGPAKRDNITVEHHFGIPVAGRIPAGIEVYNKLPWVIVKSRKKLIYKCVSRCGQKERVHNLVLSDISHSRFDIYHADKNAYLKGGLHSLTMLPSDQILFAGVLSGRRAAYLHACGVVFSGKGLLFAGHSGAGKTTLAKMCDRRGGLVLCDDRIVARGHGGRFRIYGTWSNGEFSKVSGENAPLKGIFFLRKAGIDRISRIEDKKEIFRQLGACLIKPLQTVGWWEKMLVLLEQISRSVPAYTLDFNKAGRVVELLRKLR